MDDQFDDPSAEVFLQREHDTVDHGDRMLEIAGVQRHCEVLSGARDSVAQVRMSRGGLVGCALANEPVKVAVDRIRITEHGDQIASRIGQLAEPCWSVEVVLHGEQCSREMAGKAANGVLLEDARLGSPFGDLRAVDGRLGSLSGPQERIDHHASEGYALTATTFADLE